VRERLENFHFIKLQAENPTEPATAELLDSLGVHGLPAFIILKGALENSGSADL